MSADALLDAMCEDLEGAGLGLLSRAIGRARPEVLEDALYLVFPPRERYAFHRATERHAELAASLRTLEPRLWLRIHRQADDELFGL